MTKKKTTKQASRHTPEWASQPFSELVDYVQNLEHILRLSMKGISMIRAVPKAVEALAKVNADEQNTTYEERFRYAKEEAELAQKEVDSGFPLLHAQAVVSLWGSLEAQIRRFLASWLANEPKALLASQVQKLKVQLGDYERLDKEERPYYILDLLEREIQSPLKQGVTRFESLLDIFGLAGGVDESVRKNLFEMNQIRNVIVHRQGKVDNRLISACPWLNIGVGETIVVSHKDYNRYSHAAVSYVTELVVRTAVYFGKSRDDFKEELDALKNHTPKISVS